MLRPQIEGGGWGGSVEHFLLFDIRKHTQKQAKTNPKHHPKFMENQWQSMEIHEIILLIGMIILWSHYQACPSSTAKFTAHMHTHRWSLLDGITSRCACCTLLKLVLMFTGDADVDASDAQLAAPEDGQDPVDKVCFACRRHRAQRTPYELKFELPLLMWGLPKGWGDFCHWCCRAGKLRWGWFTSTSLHVFVDKSEENRIDVVDYGIAMVTLKIDNWGQITLPRLEARKQMLELLGQLKQVGDSSVTEVWLLEEFRSAFPCTNPIEMSLKIVQLNIGGVQRLGVMKTLTASNAPQEAWPANADMDQRLRCSHDTDVSLLRTFSSEAKKQVRLAVCSPAPSSEAGSRSRAGSGGRGGRRRGPCQNESAAARRESSLFGSAFTRGVHCRILINNIYIYIYILHI